MAFLNAGAKLIFVDHTLNDRGISMPNVISNITENTKAILAVNIKTYLEYFKSTPRD